MSKKKKKDIKNSAITKSYLKNIVIGLLFYTLEFSITQVDVYKSTKAKKLSIINLLSYMTIKTSS